MKFTALILAFLGAASAGYYAPGVLPAANTYSAPLVSAYSAPYAAPYAAPFAPVVRSAYYAAPSVAVASPTLVRSAYAVPAVSTYSAVVPAAVAPGAVTIEAWKKKAAA